VENEKIKREGGAGKSENKKEIEVEQAKRMSYVQASVTPSDLILVEQQCRGTPSNVNRQSGKYLRRTSRSRSVSQCLYVVYGTGPIIVRSLNQLSSQGL